MHNLITACFINALSRGSDFFKAKPRSGLSTSHTFKLEQLKISAVEDWKCVVQQEKECQLEKTWRGEAERALCV